MGDQPDKDTSGDAQEAAVASNLLTLQRASEHLAQVEQRLLQQWGQLQSQIDGFTREAQQAWQANRSDLADQALEQRAQLMPTLAGIQDQLGRIRVRQEEIAQQRQELLHPGSTKSGSLAQTGVAAGVSSSQPTPPQKPAKPRNLKRSLLVFFCALVVLALLSGIGLQYGLRGSSSGHKTVKVQHSPTPRLPTPTPYPRPKPQSQPFQPDGSGPTTQACLNSFGHLCYSPEQIQQAFGLNALYQPGYDGSGQTIVILGTGASGTIKDDLTHFDQTWGLPDPPSFQILQPLGPPAPYSCSGGDGLAAENTLDVEWSHAIAPGANIVLLIWSNHQGNSPPDENCGLANLAGGVSYAVDHQLGQIINISYGISELGYLGETDSQKSGAWQEYQDGDRIFQNATEQGVTIVVSAGDDGVTNRNSGAQRRSFWPTPNISWPASDPYVLAVGGTLLQIQDDGGSYASEQVWNESGFGATGGGLSSVFPEPVYQQTQPNQDLFAGKRAIPDVSFPADNFLVYGSFAPGNLSRANAQWNHWDVIGGTSVSSPCWAGLIAILNQMRGQSSGLIQPALYSLRGKGFHDITSGDNSFGGVQGYSAGPGYDLASGWGTPIAQILLPALVDAIDGAPVHCPGSRRQCN